MKQRLAFRNVMNINNLRIAVLSEWSKISCHFVQKLFDSMLHRLEESKKEEVYLLGID